MKNLILIIIEEETKELFPGKEKNINYNNPIVEKE